MHTRYLFLAIASIPGLLGACRAVQRHEPAQASPPPLFEGMGRHHRAITTSSAEAQRFFDQALVWTFAFNHDEAIRSYQQAARRDPNCAMASWGIALCNGPHINNPAMDEAHSKAAWDALQKATALQEKANPTERALIQALAKRYAYPQPADRKPLDQAYAHAMRELWLANRRDADIGTLFAESLMDLRPWDLWKQDGTPQPGTEEIVAVLEEVLRLDPDHPGALHLYIHAVEGSPSPERAIAVADRLRTQVPASGHLVHMPSHIDVLTGAWEKAVDSNLAAIEADRRYRAISPRQGFYHIYMAHNHQMLTFACMMDGRSKMALEAARDIARGVPEDYARREAPIVEPFFLIRYDALVRFGRWDEILREPAPSPHLLVSHAMWHHARGVALAATGKIEEAEQAQADFRKAVNDVPKDRMLSVNRADDMLAVADHMLAGEIAYRRGHIDQAVGELRKAIEREDRLKYIEPPEWPIPVRHALGAILLSAGRVEEAEQVYRQDLDKWPENGWSLYGLAECLKKRGATAEADEVERRFKKAWANADIKIGASCLCVARG
jgi:tetratricopeptide (TPR) repeat protein